MEWILYLDSASIRCNAFSGEKSDLFANQKARGPEKVVNTLTAILSIAFFVLAFVVSVLPRF